MRWAYTAAFLALASAAVSLYWAVGGTAPLDTVGGEIEELARERSAGTIALLAAVVLAKLVAAALALYGGVLVVAGAIDPSGDVDEYALRWHVFVWDLWFFVWGVALMARRAEHKEGLTPFRLCLGVACRQQRLVAEARTPRSVASAP